MSGDRASLLIEIGCEELPARSAAELAQALADGVLKGLSAAGLGDGLGAPAIYATPRRLAFALANVPLRQPDRIDERRGPARQAAFDGSGQPTKALLGFAQSCGVSAAELTELATDKGAWMVHRAARPGAATSVLIDGVLKAAVAALPIAKPMRWGAHDAAFIRPVLWLVVLLGHDVVPARLFGIDAGRTSRGHRFHHPGPVEFADADAYVDALRGAHVIADPVARRALIAEQVTSAAAAAAGVALAPDALLDEVTQLVEWPMPITGTFDPDFLRVPQAALIETMQTNQRFFAVVDAHGALTPSFIGIANIDSSAPDEIRKGYERVIRPRFADARFFFDADLETPLAQHQKALESLTYQKAVGSVWDKSCRVAELSRAIAGRVGADAALATKAAALAKCDLMTRMVGEFPALQGQMGRIYAESQGVEADVAIALDEAYAPRQAGAPIAASTLGRVLAIADRLDTLAVFFTLGQKPSGSKDPYSLRRNALGLARTIIEGGIELDLDGALREALDLVDKQIAQVSRAMPDAAKRAAKAIATADQSTRARELGEFIIERLRGYYADAGIGGDVFDAVAKPRPPTSLSDFDARLRAVARFRERPEAMSLAAANKRIGNLLRQATDLGHEILAKLDPKATAEMMSQAQAFGQERFAEINRWGLNNVAPAFGHSAAEEARRPLDASTEDPLAAFLAQVEAEAKRFIASADYEAALAHMATLNAPLDAFFESTLVMVDDRELRANRLALLARVRKVFLEVADIGLLR